MPGEPGDLDLVRRARGGDEAAFGVLYERHHAGIYRFALRMSGSASVADDVLQEVFLALLDDTVGFDPQRGALASFLFGVARHKVLKRLARERPYVPLDDAFALVEAGPAEGSLVESLLRQERSGLVWKALLSLPPHYREVIVLCEMHEWSYADAAKVLDCAIGTVRSRLSRGRDQLAERLRASVGEGRHDV